MNKTFYIFFMRVHFQIRRVMYQSRVATFPSLFLKKHIGLCEARKKPAGKQGKRRLRCTTDIPLSRAPRLSRDLLAFLKPFACLEEYELGPCCYSHLALTGAY
jgi:hypothetical protein